MRPELEAHIRHILESDGLKASEVVSPSRFESVMDAQAAEAVQRLERHEPVPEPMNRALEAIVLPKLRPVFDIRDDSFADCPHPWTEVNNHREKLTKAIRAIGRVDAPGIEAPYAGTAFLVGEGVLLTNRHVAEVFTSGLGVKNLKFRFGMQPEIDLKQEIGSQEEVVLKVTQTLVIHPYWDAALLKVEGFPADRSPLTLAGQSPPQLQGRLVTIIGYPAMDSRNDLALQKRIFKVFEKKRMQPGRVMSMKPTGSYGRVVEAVAHDCSTLGGNSGSALIDVETGMVLGLHFAGEYLKANFAAPAWELALDQRLIDFGVSVRNKPDPAPQKEWLNVWQKLEQA